MSSQTINLTGSTDEDNFDKISENGVDQFKCKECDQTFATKRGFSQDFYLNIILSCSANVSKTRQVDGVALGMLRVLRIILNTGNIIGNNEPVILIISAFYCPLA